jgi:hypothetical protein
VLRFGTWLLLLLRIGMLSFGECCLLLTTPASSKAVIAIRQQAEKQSVHIYTKPS